MNSRFLNFTRFLSAGALAGMLVTAAAAQDAARERPRGEGRLARPVLDEKQRELLREAMQNHRDTLRELDQKSRTAQTELMQVVLSEKPDDAAIRQKADALAKVQVEQTVLRAKIASVLVPTLTPEQREQFENSPMALMMLGGGLRGPMDRGGPAREGQRERGGRGAPEGDRPQR